MALSNLYFLASYNNYYNREIKYQETIDDYLDAAMATSRVFGYNFNIADQVNTSIVINANEIIGNYLVVEDQTKDDIVASRWFILEIVWLRQGQFRISLRRDLVADFLKPLLSSTVYVEKGWITQDTTAIQNMNPLIFNQESFTANQIKKKETLLKDYLGCKWVVGYLNKDAIQADQGQNYKKIKTWTNEAATPDATYSSLAASPINGFFDPIDKRPIAKRYALSTTAVMDIAYYAQSTSPQYWRHKVGKDTWTKSQIGVNQYQGYITCNYAPSLPVSLSSTAYGAENGNYDNILAGLKIKFQNDFAVYPEVWNAAQTLNGKIIYIANEDTYYKVNISKQGTWMNTSAVDPNTDAANYNRLVRYATTGAQPCNTPTVSGLNFRLETLWSEALLVNLEAITNTGYSVDIYPEKMNKTNNEAFDAFAIPVLEDKVYLQAKDGNGVDVYNVASTDYDSAFAIGQALMRVSDQALDLQLLPFCPLPSDWIIPAVEDNTKKRILAPNGTVDVISRPIWNDTGATVNAIYFLSRTDFSTFIPVEDPCDYSSIEEIKAINQCDTWRLYSGDYSSSFEFNIARNGGLAYFEIDCKYKPYQPYIHIAPNFGGLYGTDYDDTRGLVCSNTNFSLPRLTNAWETYERNNLNYMNAFNRQIENMDVQRKYQKLQENVGLGVGVLQGAGTGAYMGSIGGPWGIAAGAALGAAGAIGAGIVDWQTSEALYKENKQYAKDQFKMSLQNIQALPNTLAAVGAQNPNNKVFPVLCFYSCSPVEREAFKKKIKWDGMTIGVISEKISDYINPNEKTYFKGQLVYVPSSFYDITNQTTLRYDPHEVAELANELAKGILIDKGVIN